MCFSCFLVFRCCCCCCCCCRFCFVCVFFCCCCCCCFFFPPRSSIFIFIFSLFKYGVAQSVLHEGLIFGCDELLARGQSLVTMFWLEKKLAECLFNSPAGTESPPLMMALATADIRSDSSKYFKYWLNSARQRWNRNDLLIQSINACKAKCATKAHSKIFGYL